VVGVVVVVRAVAACMGVYTAHIAAATILQSSTTGLHMHTLWWQQDEALGAHSKKRAMDKARSCVQRLCCFNS
jgi:hypothetical protein